MTYNQFLLLVSIDFLEAYEEGISLGGVAKYRVVFQYVKSTRKPASRVFLAPPEGLVQFLPSFNHA